MKICHLVSSHNRYDIRVFRKECISLAKDDNFEVHLMVCDGLGNEQLERGYLLMMSVN